MFFALSKSAAFKFSLVRTFVASSVSLSICFIRTYFFRVSVYQSDAIRQQIIDLPTA
jgi:hypothetical protein